MRNDAVRGGPDLKNMPISVRVQLDMTRINVVVEIVRMSVNHSANHPVVVSDVSKSSCVCMYMWHTDICLLISQST